MQILPTPHLDKLEAVLVNDKLPRTDQSQIQKAIQTYRQWVVDLGAVQENDVNGTVRDMVSLLNTYRNFLDIEIIFDSKEDFLYRQKGQIKLDNSVIEEFLPHLIKKCILNKINDDTLELGPKQAFSKICFSSIFSSPESGCGVLLRTKNQDFTVSRRVYMKTSYSPDFQNSDTNNFSIAYLAAECKTNLDKTMFQEASATATDVKAAVKGSKYFLLCEWLDMTPQSTAATSIDEVLLLRRAKRLASNIRSQFSNYQGRKAARQRYIDFIDASPFDTAVFERFVAHVSSLIKIEDPIENDVLSDGYF